MACVPHTVVATQQQVHNVVIQLRENGREHNLETERKKTADGLEVKGKGRSPGAVIPKQQCVYGDVEQILRGECPVAEIQCRQYHADNARNECRRHPAFRNLLDLHLFGKIGRLRHTETGEHETEEYVAAQGNQFGTKFGLVVIVGYQRRTEPQHHVDSGSGEDIEPEDSVIILVGRSFQINQPGFKATRLQLIGDDREHSQHRRHTIVRRIK